MKKLRIIIFNVDHGFCAFIRSPNNYALLIDCGATEIFSPIKYIMENELSGIEEYPGLFPFESHKLTQFVLSHPHNDHLMDIERLRNDLEPAFLKRQVYDWEKIKTVAEDKTEAYKNLDSFVRFQDSYSSSSSESIDWGMKMHHGIFFTPDDAKKINESLFVNNSSIPTFIEYQNYKIIFPGDLCESGWKELLKKNEFKNALRGTSFFVAAHHGHSSGYCKEIFDCMGKPFFNIVSANQGDDSVEPSYSKADNAKGVLYDGVTRYMFSTRNDGSIVLEITEDGKATFNFLQLDENIEKVNQGWWF